MEKQTIDLPVRTRQRYSDYFLSRKKTNQKKFRGTVVHHWTSPKANKFSVFPQASAIAALPVHQSFEKFPLFDLKALHYYIIDLLETQKIHDTGFRKNTDKRVWLEQLCKRISGLLEGEIGPFFSSPEYLYVKITYKQTKKGLNVGRLYPTRLSSYVFFSREIRAILQKKQNYYDFDIVNAHPTLLLEYVKVHMPDYHPKWLDFYVNNRDQFLKEKSEKDKCSMGDAKTSLLKILNCQEYSLHKFGSFAEELYGDCSEIRNHIYKNTYKKGSALYLYFEGNKKFHKKTLEEKKVTVQSLYLQSMETDAVYGLILFLRTHFQEWLESGVEDSHKEGFSSLLLDRAVDIDPLDYNFSCIPFFDGLYVTSENPIIRQELPVIVALYNEFLIKSGSLVQFKEKSIEGEVKNIDHVLYFLYAEVTKYIDTLSSRQFNELLVLLDVPALSFNDDHTLNTPNMLNTSREFRRNIYRNIIESHQKYNIPLNSDFLKRLKVVYKDRLKAYLVENRFHDDSD